MVTYSLNGLKDFSGKIVLLFFFLCLSLSCEKKESDLEAPQTPPPTIPDQEIPEPTNTPPVQRYGQLKVSGNKIIGKDGEAVQLRGMSLFWSQWIGKYYTASTIKWLKDDWRCTVVRAALAVEPDGYLKNPEIEKQKIITVVDAAIAEGLYVIIDWHDHHAELHQKQAKTFFADMAQRYKDAPNVIYETFNEPLDVSWSQVLKPYHQAIIDTIRMYDSDNIIVCGTRTWSQQVDETANDPIARTNIAYTLHFYASTHKKWLRDRATQALNKGIAIMITEYGTTEASGNGYMDEAETKLWWQFADENKLSWCNWSLADKVEASAALKPGASTTGNWPESEITPSGLFVRKEMRAKNPAPK